MRKSMKILKDSHISKVCFWVNFFWLTSWTQTFSCWFMTLVWTWWWFSLQTSVICEQQKKDLNGTLCTWPVFLQIRWSPAGPPLHKTVRNLSENQQKEEENKTFLWWIQLSDWGVHHVTPAVFSKSSQQLFSGFIVWKPHRGGWQGHPEPTSGVHHCKSELSKLPGWTLLTSANHSSCSYMQTTHLDHDSLLHLAPRQSAIEVLTLHQMQNFWVNSSFIMEAEIQYLSFCFWHHQDF